MYEFRIIHLTNKNERIIFGYNKADACRRAKLDPAEWDVTDVEYVD